MSDQVVILGTGSFAQVAHFYLAHDTDYEVVAFTATADHLTASEMSGLPVVPFESLVERYPPGDFKMFVAIGYAQVNKVRAEFYRQVKSLGYECVSYISSKCTHWGDTVIGENCFIFEDNTIQPFVTIGDDVVMWSGNHIGHHAKIAEHCFVTSHVVVSGHTRVGPYCFLGVNATLRDDISIGEACVVGAGALIMKSTQPFEVYPGSATLPLSRKSFEIRM